MTRNTRGVLYWIAKILGDINAIMGGRTARRAGRRITGKAVRRWFR